MLKVYTGGKINGICIDDEHNLLFIAAENKIVKLDYSRSGKATANNTIGSVSDVYPAMD